MSALRLFICAALLTTAGCARQVVLSPIITPCRLEAHELPEEQSRWRIVGSTGTRSFEFPLVLEVADGALSLAAFTEFGNRGLLVRVAAGNTLVERHPLFTPDIEGQELAALFLLLLQDREARSRTLAACGYTLRLRGLGDEEVVSPAGEVIALTRFRRSAAGARLLRSADPERGFAVQAFEVSPPRLHPAEPRH